MISSDAALKHPPAAAATAAERQAAANWSANLRALAQAQPRLVAAVQPLPAKVAWIYGRDGTLTGMENNGRWWSGCSLPGRAARAMLRTMQLRGTTACFLAPAHAAQLSVALEMMRPEQAVIAIVPPVQGLRIMLSCHDFSDAIGSQRLWFAWGEHWTCELRCIFADHPGLAVPGQLIRTPATADDVANLLIPQAQRVFSDVSAARARLLNPQ